MTESYLELVQRLRRMRSPGNSVAIVASYVSELPEGVPNLERIVLEEDDMLKCEALELMFELRRPDALKLSEWLLECGSQDIRRAVCEIMGDIPGNKSLAELTLIAQLDRERDPGVRYAAVFALARIGSVRALPVLYEIIQTDASVDFEGRPISDLASIAINLITDSDKGSGGTPFGHL